MRSCLSKICVFILAVAGLPASAAEQTHTLLVVGDSLSAGYGLEDQTRSWVALLQRRLITEGYGYHVVNASISGDTTSGGLRRLPRALELHHPDVVVIELGGNDGLRGTPVAVIEANLTTMIEDCKAARAKVVLAGMRMPPSYGEYADRFDALYPAVATARHVPLVGFLLDSVALHPELVQADGIHPTAAAQGQLLNNVWPVLKKVL